MNVINILYEMLQNPNVALEQDAAIEAGDPDEDGITLGEVPDIMDMVIGDDDELFIGIQPSSEENPETYAQYSSNGLAKFSRDATIMLLDSTAEGYESGGDNVTSTKTIIHKVQHLWSAGPTGHNEHNETSNDFIYNNEDVIYDALF